MEQIATSPAPQRKLLTQFEQFARTEAFGGILLTLSALSALVWANSSWSGVYFQVQDMSLALTIGSWTGQVTIRHLVNDGLMAIFFLVVGLEIKQELLVGELDSWRRASLPIAAALGGTIMPAVVFLVLNAGLPEQKGWAIPIATDIAFALAILSLLGNRVPAVAKVFLASVAILDDIVSIVVIATFYASDVVAIRLTFVAAACALLFVLNHLRVTSVWIYLLNGLIVWLLLSGSGIHSTIAGVILALAIPIASPVGAEQLPPIGMSKLQEFRGVTTQSRSIHIDKQQERVINELETLVRLVKSPVIRLQEALHPWSTLLIVPLFAFLNSGVKLSPESVQVNSLTLGIVLGLLVGKPLGIILLSALAVRMNMSEPPENLSAAQFIGVSFLAGIGFTMSLLISELAFEQAVQKGAATIAIFIGSALAATIGATILLLCSPKRACLNRLGGEHSDSVNACG